MGGPDTPENLVEVTVTQHAMFHFCNFQLWGNVEDFVAWRGLSGQISEEEFLKEKFKLFGQEGYSRYREKLENNPELAEEYERKRRETWNKNKDKNLIQLMEAQKLGVEAARTPEAIENKKKTLKEIDHQQGEKNSQYDTMWIHNPLTEENAKIHKDDPLPEGWFRGRVTDEHRQLKIEEKKQKRKLRALKQKEEKRNEKVKFYTEWYEIYKENDFKTFCEITGYNKSQQNLCSKFKEFVNDYDPKAKNGHTT
jgi:hypothetical protein